MQTTLLIKTVPLCSKPIFAQGGGRGDTDCARKKKERQEKESWMRADQAVLQWEARRSTAKNITAATKKNTYKNHHCDQFHLSTVKTKMMQTEPGFVHHNIIWLHHLVNWSQRDKMQSWELRDIKTNSSRKLMLWNATQRLSQTAREQTTMLLLNPGNRMYCVLDKHRRWALKYVQWGLRQTLGNSSWGN